MNRTLVPAINRRAESIISGHSARSFMAGLAFLVSVLLAGCSQPYQFHGAAYNLPHPAPDFNLPDMKGDTYHLAERHGRAVILFFGYTNCPDECPTTLAMLSKLRKQLISSPVDVVFISIDPDHDTPKVMQSYLSNFDPRIFGISAKKDVMLPLLTSYGGMVEYQPDGSVKDHTSFVYLIDPAGNWRTQYDYPAAQNDLLADIQYVLTEKG